MTDYSASRPTPPLNTGSASGEHDAPTMAPAPPFKDEPRRSGWHPVNVGQLVMSLLFACAIAGWALAEAGVVSGDDIRWLLPLPWLIAGAVGLAAAGLSGARRHGVRR